MKNNLLLRLSLIFLLGLILRLFMLTQMPPSLNWDEVSHGYNAYSILKTGKDEWGQFLPLANFRAYGDYPLPLNLYLTIPFIAGLGLSPLSIRLPHALLGAFTVVSVFYLAYGVTKNARIGVLSALLVAIEPWYFFTSRFVLQSNLSVFLFISGIAFFFNREKHKVCLPLAFLSLGLTLYSYHSSRIFIPILLFVMLVIYYKELIATFKEHRQVSVILIFVLIILFLPLPFILSQPEARARSKFIFLIDDGAVNRIIEARVNSKLPPLAARIIYNRPTYFIRQFSSNYLGYFSPKFLFLSGGTQYQFSVQGKGLLYPVNLPFFYIGLFILLKSALKGGKKYRFLAIWLFIAPMPASITTEKLAVLRSTPMLPLPQLLTAIGLFSSWKWTSKVFNFLRQRRTIFKYLILGGYAVLLTVSIGQYLNTYFNDYRKTYSWAWQYGYKEVVEYAKKHYDEYDKIIVTKKYGEPHEFILFFWPWPPERYQEDPNLIRFYQSNWYWVDRFDKFYFVNDWEIPKEDTGYWKLEIGKEIEIKGNILLISSPNNYPSGWKLLKAIYFLDGKPAFEILEKI